MFPEHPVPNNIDGLISTFLGTGALVDFSQAQTLSRAEAVLTLSGAHGIDVDFSAIFYKIPVDDEGKEVDLVPFEARVVPLAEKLLEFLEARAKELEELEAQEDRKSVV